MAWSKEAAIVIKVLARNTFWLFPVTKGEFVFALNLLVNVPQIRINRLWV
jgi:hypothetical protein